MYCSAPSGVRSRFSVLRSKFSVLLVLAVASSLVAPAQAAGRSFLWKVTGKGGVVYLAGSVHMLTEAHYPLAPAFDAAYKDSDLLVEELDMAELLAPTAQMMFLSKGMLDRKSTRLNSSHLGIS